jgi:hypothetical protein
MIRYEYIIEKSYSMRWIHMRRKREGTLVWSGKLDRPKLGVKWLCRTTIRFDVRFTRSIGEWLRHRGPSHLHYSTSEGSSSWCLCVCVCVWRVWASRQREEGQWTELYQFPSCLFFYVRSTILMHSCSSCRILDQDQKRVRKRKLCRRKWEHAPLIAVSLATLVRLTASCQGKASLIRMQIYTRVGAHGPLFERD